MANRFSIASGLASNTATWDGGLGVPVTGDRVLVTRLSSGLNTFSTNTTGYAIGSTDITLTGTVLAGSYVVGESVRFGTDINYYTITGWNLTTKVLSVSALIVAIPAAATVVTAAGHFVTLDGTYEWGDDVAATTAVTINGISTTSSITIAGALLHPRNQSSQLTCLGKIIFLVGSTHDMGTFASPIPLPHTAKLVLNKSATLLLNEFGVQYNAGCYSKACGATKKRITTLTTAATAGNLSIQVTNADGWQVGDEVIVPNTGLSNYGFDIMIIAAGYISGALTVPFTAALTYDHLNTVPVSNMTSNVTYAAFSAVHMFTFYVQLNGSSVENSHEWAYMTVDTVGSVYQTYGVQIGQDANYTATTWVQMFKYMESVSYIARNTSGYVAYLHGSGQALAERMQLNNCSYVNTSAGVNAYGMYDFAFADHNDCFFHAASPYIHGSVLGSSINRGYLCQTSSIGSVSSTINSVEMVFNGVKFVGNTSNGVSGRYFTFATAVVSGITTKNSDFTTYKIGAPVSLVYLQSVTSSPKITLENCAVGTIPALENYATMRLMSKPAYVRIKNRNSDITLQEDWSRDGLMMRENTIKNRSSSSASMRVSTVGVVFSKTILISASIGETVRIVGYVRYDAAFYNTGTGFVAPTATLSGTINNVTLTPVVATAASNNSGNWHPIDISITNTSGAAGQLSLTLSAVQNSVVTGLVYFDGIVFDDMVTTARHYGFVFDEANPKRTVNITTGANEATAQTYSGVTVSWGAASSITAFSADKTFQYLYDYTQYQACLNQNSKPPLTGVGVAGSPALFALGNITITSGYKLNGTGSISMGSYTLSSELAGPIPYTYTGGTWSQLTTVPTVNGGQLNIGAAGTFTLTMGGSTIYSMTPTAAGTYILSAGSFTGTVDLRNTSAFAITVQLPVGASYTTANNVGGLITVVAAATVGVRVTALTLDTSAPVQNARVYLLAASGGPLAAGTVILSGLTDVNGIFENAAFTYSSNQPVTGKVRKSTGSPLYKTAPLSGNITASGFSATAFMIGDEA